MIWVLEGIFIFVVDASFFAAAPNFTKKICRNFPNFFYKLKINLCSLFIFIYYICMSCLAMKSTINIWLSLIIRIISSNFKNFIVNFKLTQNEKSKKIFFIKANVSENPPNYLKYLLTNLLELYYQAKKYTIKNSK